MRIAIASGKGGTGKTTVAIHLAQAFERQGQSVTLVDADAEAPNVECFLTVDRSYKTNITQDIPHFNSGICIACRRCVSACAWNALALVRGRIIFSPDLCHGCGVCTLVCPSHAITEESRQIGEICQGVTPGPRLPISVWSTQTVIGTTRTPTVIRAGIAAAMKKSPKAPEKLIVVDGPPGTACPAVAAVRGADLVLLVAEATPFGLHDLQLAVELVTTLQLPHAVVVNRADEDRRVQDWCQSQGIAVLAEIPGDRAVAVAYAQGKLPGDCVPGYAARFDVLANSVQKMVQQ